VEGWVEISDLVEGIKGRLGNHREYEWLTPEHIIAVAKLDPKGRFEVRGGRIRARYGHSIGDEIKYPVASDHTILYHGTSIESLGSILKHGLLPMKRRFVHLTGDPELAFETGRRHGHPIVLRINVECLRKHGLIVYRATDKIYLVKRVHPECIQA
jgi:putative RNA 2'-phosphotransferase